MRSPPRRLFALACVLAGLAAPLHALAQPASPAPPLVPGPFGLQPAPPVPLGAPPASPPVAAPTLTPGPGSATPAAPVPPGVPPGPPPPAVVDPAEMGRWEARYVAARQAFAEGRFGWAASELAEIARRAPNWNMRAHAAEIGAIARYWDAENLILVAQREGGARARESMSDKRTIDELAILYTNTAIWGAGFGITTGVAINDGNAAGFIVPGLGMAAAGATAVALLDNLGPHQLHYGVPQSITTGLYVGFEEGLFATFLGTSVDHNFSGAAAGGLMWGGSTAGAVIGGIAGESFGTTPGRASLVESGAIWGGAITSFLTAGFLGDHADSDTVLAGVGISGLAGTSLGAVGGGLLASTLSPSIARARFIDLGGLGGGLVFGGIYASAAGNNFSSRAFFLLSAIGATSGLISVAAATSKMERDDPRRHEESSAAARISPMVMPVRGGATLGAVGVF